MSTHFKRILYGGDYNPNQWTKDIWQEDMRIFKDAHINTATINVFSWAKIQPSEHEYNFDELDEIFDAEVCECQNAIVADSVDPDDAVFDIYLPQPFPVRQAYIFNGTQRSFRHTLPHRYRKTSPSVILKPVLEQ